MIRNTKSTWTRILIATFIAILLTLIRFYSLKRGLIHLYNNLYGTVEKEAIKIYIYDIPDELLLKDQQMTMESCPNSFYSIEIKLPTLLRNSSWHLKNVKEVKEASLADYYLIPHYSTCLYHLCLQRATNNGVQDCQGEVSDYLTNIIDHVEETYPFWSRKRGADHLFIFTWDWGVHLFGEVQESVLRGRLANSIHLTLMGSTGNKHRLMFDARKDISIPPWRDFSVLKYAPKPPHRAIYAYFRGTVLDDPSHGHGIRQKLLQFAKDDPTHFFVETKHNNFYWHELMNARFVLCPPGWSHWSARLFDAIVAGAIPVIISDDWQPAFHGTLVNYKEFSVRIREKDIDKLSSILKSITLEKEAQMRGRLEQVAHRFIYNDPSIIGDATDSIMQVLSRRPVPAALKPLIVVDSTDADSAIEDESQYNLSQDREDEREL